MSLGKSEPVPPAVSSSRTEFLDAAMHFYQFHIGDYQSHTAHLEPLEDIAYRRMLDWCYLHERPLPDDVEHIARLIRMRTHNDCIASVLQEFFNRTLDGWWHQRIEREIAASGEKSRKASESAKVRWAKEKVDANALRPQSEGNATNTHNPIPNTQDPLPKEVVTRDLGRSPPPAPISEIVEMYNRLLPMLPQVTVMNDSRKRLVSARWREVVTTDKLDHKGGLEFFEWFFGHVRKSKFLTGQNKDWKASFEFLFTANKFPKIVEGAYHGDEQ